MAPTTRAVSAYRSEPPEHRAEVAPPLEEQLEGFEPPSIAAGGLDALIFRGGELVAKVALVFVTGRLMEPAGRGLYALAALCAALCALPFGSIWVANAVELARRRVTVRELLGVSTVIATVGGVGTALVALAVAPFLGDRWWVVALPALVTPFALLARYQEGLYTAIGHIRAVNLVRIGRAVLPLVFITPPLLLGASHATAIGAWTLMFVALPILVWFPQRALIGRPQIPRERALYHRIVAYGLKISGLNIVPLLNDRVALIALAAFVTEAAVGVYSIAIAATEVVILATQALALATFRRIGSDAREASAALTARTVRHSVLLAVVGIVLLIPAVAVVVPPALGPGYEDVPLLLVILVPTVIVYAAMQPLAGFFSVQAATPSVLLKATVPGLATNISLTAALTPMWGIWGAGIAASTAGLLAIAVAIWCFMSESGTRLGALRPGRREVADYITLAGSLLGRLKRRS